MMTNTYLPHVGGVAKSVATFTEQYRTLGHDVLVVAPEFEGKPLPKRVESLVERVPAIQKFNGSDFSVRLPLAAGLSDRIDGFNADIIHAHHPFLLGDTALRLSVGKAAPVIFTHHTRYEDYTHYVPFDSPALKEVAIHLSTHFANLCDGVIAPSESIAELIKSRGVETPIRVVPTGIDVDAFAAGDGPKFRRKVGLPARAFVVGHVGRLAPEKNLGFLSKAVAEFLSTHTDAWFLVVGAGPSEDEIKKACEDRGVSERLVMAGKQTGRALADAYQAMDAFVFASFSETQGMVLAEAMAAGLPVVALDASGVREVLRHNKNGFMLSPKTTPKRFAAAIERLKSNPDRAAALAREARRTAESFSATLCAERALDFYTEVRRATRRERMLLEQSPWNQWVERLRVEWNLLAEKTQSIVDAVNAVT